MSERAIRRMLMWARIAFNGSMAGLMGCVVVLLAVCPGVLQAQDAGSILTASTAIAEKLPQDVVKLCLVAVVVMALVLGSSVVLFLRALNGNVDRMLNALSSKPCLMNSTDGQAILRDGIREAAKQVGRG